MDHRGQDAPFLIEELDGLGIVDLQNGLQGHVPVHESVVCFVYDSHASAPEDFPELVAFLQTSAFRSQVVPTRPILRQARYRPY